MRSGSRRLVLAAGYALRGHSAGAAGPATHLARGTASGSGRTAPPSRAAPPAGPATAKPAEDAHVMPGGAASSSGGGGVAAASGGAAAAANTTGDAAAAGGAGGRRGGARAMQAGWLAGVGGGLYLALSERDSLPVPLRQLLEGIEGVAGVRRSSSGSGDDGGGSGSSGTDSSAFTSATPVQTRSPAGGEDGVSVDAEPVTHELLRDAAGGVGASTGGDAADTAAGAQASAAPGGGERGEWDAAVAAAAHVAAVMDAAAAAEAGVSAAPPSAAAAAAAAPPVAEHGDSDGSGSGASGGSQAGHEAALAALGEVQNILKRVADSEDLSPPGLVAAAAAAGYGPKDDWNAAAAQLRQATADALLLAQVAQDLAGKQAALESALADAKAERSAAEAESQQQAKELVAGFKALIEEGRRLADAERAEAVRAAEERIATDAAREQLKERLERTKSLDEVRAKVEALSEALGRRADAARRSTAAHRAALGAAALAAALEDGRPVARELGALQLGCPEDPVVNVVADSLPMEVAIAGLPTRAELEEGFERVASAARQLSYFEPGSGGVLAHAVARLAAALKTEATGGTGAASDMAITQARISLKAGRLLEAADALSGALVGTQAEAAVAQWVADARTRAVAEQNARLLQARVSVSAVAVA